jgi:hypothetical protein
MTEDILEHLGRIIAMKSDLDRDKETMLRAAKEIKRLRADLAKGALHDQRTDGRHMIEPWHDGCPPTFSVTIRGQEAVAFVCCLTPNGTDSAVAEVYSSTDDRLDKDSALANARLIAVAPEMLAVLLALQPYQHRFAGTTGEKFRSVIAKATALIGKE